MIPALPPRNPIRLRLLGRNGQPLRINSGCTWNGTVEWQQDRCASVDLEIKAVTDWSRRTPVELQLDFCPGHRLPPTRWPAQRSLAGSLHALADGIFLPATTPGAMGVDWADYATFLPGLTIEERHVVAVRADRDLRKAFQRSSRMWARPRSLKFLALHLCLPPGLDPLRGVDDVAAAAEVLVAPDAQLTLAATHHDSIAFPSGARITAILGHRGSVFRACRS